MNENLPQAPQGEFVLFQSADGRTRVECRFEADTLWLSQAAMAELYQVSSQAITQHIKAIYEEGELVQNLTCKDYLQVQSEGNRTVQRKIRHYSLPVILSVGYRVRSTRGTQFRQWATQTLQEYLIKGFAMDDERLKNDGTILGKKYFEEQLERIREIRLSERKFYQKITDIYATSIDYDVTGQVTKRFFATVQNKLHWAIHGQTAAEVVYHRADAEKDNMGLTSWKAAPQGKIQKFDVSIAKNYLTDNELAQLQRLVNAYLDLAEDMALRQIPMTMADWELRLNRFIEATDREVLQDAGKVTATIAKAHAESEFEKYRVIQDRLFVSDFDKYMLELEENAKK